MAQTSSQLSPDEARAIAEEVFFWGMHRLRSIESYPASSGW